MSEHTKGWIKYLSDFRMCQHKHFIKSVRLIIRNESLSPDEKLLKIQEVSNHHMEEQLKLNPKDYGVNLSD
jgi:hypothetical protein